MIDLKVTYYFAQVNESTVKMIEEFNEDISALGGQQIRVVSLKASDGLLDTVSQSISCTIHESKSRSLSCVHGKMQKKFKLAKISWNLTGFVKYQVLLYKPIYDFSIGDIPTINIRYTCVPADLLIAPKPFSEGTLKVARAAYLLDPSGSESKQKFVIKESKFYDAKYNTRKYVEESIECQVMSVFLAKQFQRVSPSKKYLRYVDISYVKVKETGAYYWLEEYMDGDFIKISSNAGYINEEHYSATLDAFTHWTHQFTNEYLVVTDLQGE